MDYCSLYLLDTNFGCAIPLRLILTYSYLTLHRQFYKLLHLLFCPKSIVILSAANRFPVGSPIIHVFPRVCTNRVQLKYVSTAISLQHRVYELSRQKPAVTFHKGPVTLATPPKKKPNGFRELPYLVVTYSCYFQTLPVLTVSCRAIVFQYF